MKRIIQGLGLLPLVLSLMTVSCVPTDQELAGSSGVVADMAGASDLKSSGESDIDISDPDGSGNQQFGPGTLTAGDLDDNLNFDLFKQYVQSGSTVSSISTMPSQWKSFVNLPNSGRIKVKIMDSENVGVPNAKINVTSSSGNVIVSGQTSSDGTFYFFPGIEVQGQIQNILIKAYHPNGRSEIGQVAIGVDVLDSIPEVNIKTSLSEMELPNSLDLAFVIDATGSMGDEMNYLTREFESIIQRVEEQHPSVSINFGLVTYRDIGDDYITRTYDFTSSMGTMQGQLVQQQAGGGGDYPEAMHTALEKALNLQWRNNGTTKLLFLVADAPPHTHKIETTLNAGRELRDKGVRIHSLAASGVGSVAEAVMRSLSLVSQGRYLFLTDDSGVGNPHAKPGTDCYVVTKLNNLIARVITSELSGIRDEPSRSQVIRMVGNYYNGVCLSQNYLYEQFTQDQNTISQLP